MPILKASTVLKCQTCTMFRCKYILFGVFVHCVHKVLCGRQNEWSVSKVAPDPLSIWGLSYQNHDSFYDCGKKYAELHNVELVPGNGTFGYLSLNGSTDTYVYINNSDLAFSNGGYAFSWMMYVEPAEDNGRVTLLKYETVNGSTQLHWELLEDKTMQCTMKSSDGTIMTVKSSMNVIGKMFVGINFNFLWDDHFDFFHVYTDVVEDKQQKVEEKLLPSTSQIILQLQEAVNVNIGNGFKGNISCIQFYNSSVIGGTQKDAPLLCDQTLAYDSLFGDHTISFPTDRTSCISPTGQALLNTSYHTTTDQSVSFTNGHTTTDRAVSFTNDHITTAQTLSTTNGHTTTDQAVSSTNDDTTTGSAVSSTNDHITAAQTLSTTNGHTTTDRAVSSTNDHTTTAQAVSSTNDHTTTDQAVSSTYYHTTTGQAVSFTNDHTTTDKAVASTNDHTTTDQVVSSTNDHTTTDQAVSFTNDHTTTDKTVASTNDHTTTDKAVASTNDHTTTDKAVASTNEHTTTDKAVASTNEHTTTDKAVASTKEHTTTDQVVSSMNDHTTTGRAVSSMDYHTTIGRAVSSMDDHSISYITTSSMAVPFIQYKTTGKEYVLDSCIRFKKISINTRIANPEQTLLVSDIGTCAQMCWDVEFCYIFSVKIKPGFHLLECSLSDKNFSTVASLDSVGLFTIY